MKKLSILPDLAITEISLGAAGRGDPAQDAAHFAVIDRYRELGGNCLDTARKYAEGRSDEALGRYLKSRGCRGEVILCTKGCHPADTAAMHISRLSPAEIREDLELSLKALGVEYTDLHLLHRDNPRIPVEEIMPALDALVREGKVRAIGCSNWTVGRIQEANDFARANGLTPFSVCQLHFSLALTTPAQTRDVTHVTMNDIEFGWYKETGFPVMGFGSQGRGYFARLASGAPMKPGPRQYYDFIPENRRRAQRLQTLSEDLGVSLASVALAYVRDNALRASALCGFSSVEQLEDAFQALTFRLTPEQIAYLETGR